MSLSVGGSKFPERRKIPSQGLDESQGRELAGRGQALPLVVISSCTGCQVEARKQNEIAEYFGQWGANIKTDDCEDYLRIRMLPL
jgi:hypothetical protein